MQQALSNISTPIMGGNRVLVDEYAEGYYVTPALVEMPKSDRTVQEETFASNIYIYPYQDLNDAIKQHNDVPQGLSSSIFTLTIYEKQSCFFPSSAAMRY